MKKTLGVIVGALLLATASACNGGSGQTSGDLTGNLKVAVYLGGYGQVWINTLARAFEAENEGVTVEIEANPELQSEIPNRLQNGSDDDLFFSHGIAWEKAAVQGYIEPLDDLYQMEVEDGVKFEDRVSQSFLSTAKFNNRYYKVPWTNGAGGMIYNKKMFDANGWTVPTTYEELYTLSQTIANAKIKVDPNNTKPNAPTIKPFVWSSETYYWDYVVFDWWAQLAGVEKIQAYTELASAEVFNPTTNPELMKAFEAWVNLVAKNPEWSMEDSAGKQYMAAQMDFINGFAAMIPCAQWLEMEMFSNIDPNTVEMALMPTPFIEGAKTNTEGKPIRVNYAVGAGDSIIIPASSSEKALAKEFLRFIAKKESLKTFTEKTNGVMLAMDYTGVSFEETDLSTFGEGIVDTNKNAQKFDLYSSSLLVLDGKLAIQWAPEGVQHYADYYNYYNTSAYISDPNAVEEKNIFATFNGVYQTVKNNWQAWLDEIIA